MSAAGLSFGDVLTVCAQQAGFVAQYDRLTGAHLGDVLATVTRGSPIAREIDQQTGRARDELTKFAAFVYEVVWTRLERYDCRAAPSQESEETT